MSTLTLEDVIKQAKQAVDLKDWPKAENLLQAVLNQVPVKASRNAFAMLVYLLTQQKRNTEATQALKQRLISEPVQLIKRGSPGSPKIVMLLGLQEPNFLIHSSRAEDFTFEINSGHYKIVDVLGGVDCELHQVFLYPEQDVAAIGKELAAPDLIINTIADTEKEGRSLERAGRLLQICSAPVINLPAQVAPTSRSEIYEILKNTENLVIPKTLKWQQRADCQIPENEFDWDRGVMIRAVGSQTSMDLPIYHSPQSVQQELERSGGDDLFLTQFKDFKSADGKYRKYRMFVIDGRLYPEHLIICDKWNIHSSDQLRIMTDQPTLKDEEAAYLKEPEKVLGSANYQTLESIHSELKLDYFGIDFTLLPDGQPLVFETNPAMRINLDFVDRFPYQKPAIDNVIEAFRRMIASRIQELAG